MFSIIMPSYLGIYKGSATNREIKLHRAIYSVLEQTFKEWELIVVSDGCEKTNKIVKEDEDYRIKLIKIEKQPIWSGNVRETGLKQANGKYICYLDSDDCFGNNHLQLIYEQLNDYEWVWFNDYRKIKGKWQENSCDIQRKGRCGTSNICHKRELNVSWNKSGYGLDDYYFCQNLLKYRNFTKINTPEYLVCHVPSNVLNRGYDA